MNYVERISNHHIGYRPNATFASYTVRSAPSAQPTFLMLTALEQRAIALGELFASSIELSEALHAAHGAADPQTAAQVERLYQQPFALSRAYDDF